MRAVQALLVAGALSGIQAFQIPGLGDVALPLFRRMPQGPPGGSPGSPGSPGSSGSSGSSSSSSSSSSSPSGSSSPGSCPSVWTTIASDLSGMFVSNGQCNDDARAAIRLAFHDCATWDFSQGESGGCDGSIILGAGEINRFDNQPLGGIANKLHGKQQQYGVGVADIIQFAGAVAIVSCPGGPRIQTYVGRKDSSVPAPDGLLPDTNAPAQQTLQLFENKGFSAHDLAALIGAHTSSRQFLTDRRFSGEPQDPTPGIWDVSYYQSTLSSPPGTFVLPGDIALANDATVGPEFHSFIGNAAGWGGAFSQAMTRMSLLGVAGGASALTDCSSAIPGGSAPQ